MGPESRGLGWTGLSQWTHRHKVNIYNELPGALERAGVRPAESSERKECSPGSARRPRSPPPPQQNKRHNPRLVQLEPPPTNTGKNGGGHHTAPALIHAKSHRRSRGPRADLPGDAGPPGRVLALRCPAPRFRSPVHYPPAGPSH